MNLNQYQPIHSDRQTAMSLAWAGIVYSGGFAVRGNTSKTPSQEASI
jgi:hypothetical protein